MDSSTGSTSLANSTASLTALSNSLTYLTIVLKNQANMKEGLFDALQPYSYKIYTTLNNSLDAERYYSSDRDRSEC